VTDIWRAPSPEIAVGGKFLVDPIRNVFCPVVEHTGTVAAAEADDRVATAKRAVAVGG
jgi:hypothetical protein